jgi:hypothetical protein
LWGRKERLSALWSAVVRYIEALGWRREGQSRAEQPELPIQESSQRGNRGKLQKEEGRKESVSASFWLGF